MFCGDNVWLPYDSFGLGVLRASPVGSGPKRAIRNDPREKALWL